jgi:non-specific serine/threonine protein kinase
MVIDERGAFGDLLRQYRVAAGLTQAMLAERAGLSERGVQDLERGVRAVPHVDTVRRLGEALGLPEEDRASLQVARRRHGPAVGGGAQPRLILPLQLASFVGRKHELAQLLDLLANSRLVTLTGSGGIGKTRLAVEAARHLADTVVLVELGALADPVLVPQAVAAATSVHQAGARPIVDVLIDWLGDRSLLIVLDTCEHLVDACAELCQTLLLRCPRLRILATSRQPLGIDGEVVSRVLPLAVPLSEDLSTSEAAALFIERAVAVQPDFTVSIENAPPIAEICRRLDGIPLAIELAAVWVTALSVNEIASRLDDRFRLLARGSRTALPRHQTLRGALDWSYDLLSDAERLVFRRLAVFEGGWTADAAEHMCTGSLILREEALNLLAALLDKSLVLAETRVRPARYRMLDTTRQYALDLLTGSDELESIRTRHMNYFLALARQGQHELLGPEQLHWLRCLDVELDNLRAALHCAVERGDSDTEIEMTASLWEYWWTRGYLSEGRRIIEDALGRAVAMRSRTQAKATHGAAMLAALQGDLAVAGPRFAESVALLREVGEVDGLVRPLSDLGLFLAFGGDLVRGKALVGEALDLGRRAKDEWSLGYALFANGHVQLVQGQYAIAEHSCEEEIEVCLRVGDRRALGHARVQLAIAVRRRGQHERAMALALEGLDLFHEVGDTWGLIGSLVEVAACAANGGEAECTARILGATRAFQRVIGAALVILPWQMEFDFGLEAARAALEAEEFEAAWASGEEMTIHSTIAYAAGLGIMVTTDRERGRS